MGSASGAMAYSIASPSSAFVRRISRTGREFRPYACADHLFYPPLSPFIAGCFAACCPCMAFSRNRQHLRSLQYQGTVLEAGGEENDAHCCMYCGLVITGYQWVLQVGFVYVDDAISGLILGDVGTDSPSRRNPRTLWYSWRSD
jgi:hypothetical protein